MCFTGIPWNSHFFHPKIAPPPPWKTALWQSTQAAIAEEKIRRVGSPGGVTTSPRMLVRMLMILKTFNGIHLHHHDHGAISFFWSKSKKLHQILDHWQLFFLGSLSHLVSKAVEQEKKKANAIMGEVPKKRGIHRWGYAWASWLPVTTDVLKIEMKSIKILGQGRKENTHQWLRGANLDVTLIPAKFGGVSLGGWFHFFLKTFTPIWGRFPIWRAYFSDGLVQPPTSLVLDLFPKQWNNEDEFPFPHEEIC